MHWASVPCKAAAAAAGQCVRVGAHPATVMSRCSTHTHMSPDTQPSIAT